MFECGSLHDFKCKFTTHVNYTSAVRTNYNIQSQSRLEEEIQYSHEQELKSLRKPTDNLLIEYAVTGHPIKSLVTSTPHSILIPPVKQRCNEHQYECLSNKDCIGIYNVCDGIPQCADGSDEIVNIACPTGKPTVSASMVIEGSSSEFHSDNTKYQKEFHQRKVFAPLLPQSSPNNLNQWELSNLARGTLTRPQSPSYLAQQTEISQMSKNIGSPAYQRDNQASYEENEDLYAPRNSYHEQSDFNTYDQKEHHIFDHKAGVIRDPEIDGNAFVDSKQRYPPHLSLPNRRIWQEASVQSVSPMIPNLPQKLGEQSDKDIKNTVSSPCETSAQHIDLSIKEKDNNNLNKKTQEETPNVKISKHHEEQLNTLKSNISKQNNVVKSELIDPKSVIVLENHAKEHEKSLVVAEHFQQINDNENLRPKGAVISLSLGLIATAITAALIACRLRVVKRRGHRGHGPFAHNADYLVNGMYL